MKKWKIIIIIASVLVLLWSAMLITDTVKSQQLSEPVFAHAEAAETDSSIITYKGLGYTVDMDYFVDQHGDTYVVSTEVRLFGILIAATIT